MHIRHASRHVQASITSTLTTFLRQYGWTTEAPPLQAKTFTILERQPNPSDLTAVKANTIFIGYGDESTARDRQLGGGILRREIVVFVDILSENQSIGVAVAGDVKDRVEGLIGGARYLRPWDQATGHELPGYIGEFDEFTRSPGEGSNLDWQTVQGTFYLDFPAAGNV